MDRNGGPSLRFDQDDGEGGALTFEEISARDALTLRLPARQLLDLLFLRSAGLGLLGLGSGLLAGGALQLLSFLGIFNLGGICHV